MALAVDDGASIEIDIFQFGTLVYEIISRERYKHDLFDNEEAEREVAHCRGNYEPRPWWPSLDRASGDGSSAFRLSCTEMLDQSIRGDDRSVRRSWAGSHCSERTRDCLGNCTLYTSESLGAIILLRRLAIDKVAASVEL
jgi:hypothetical protein